MRLVEAVLVDAGFPTSFLLLLPAGALLLLALSPLGGEAAEYVVELGVLATLAERRDRCHTSLAQKRRWLNVARNATH